MLVEVLGGEAFFLIRKFEGRQRKELNCGYENF
jgi:hypothetical protein